MGAITIEASLELFAEAWRTCRKETRMGTESVPLFQAIGRILAEDLAAPMDQPPFDRSPIDGYAVRSADIRGASQDHPVSLQVVGQVLAGEYPTFGVKPGTAVRIMTGAPIPTGADCTIRQEDTDYGEETVRIGKPAAVHENICDQGEDFKQGTCLLYEGEKLDAVRIGIAASMGYAHIPVYRKPKIALITTGDEVVLPGTPLEPGKIYNSNLYVVGCRLRELGNEPYLIRAVKDSAKEMRDAMELACQEADVIITTGGVSVGKKDILHDALTLLGARRLFWKIDSKPGSPVIGSVYGQTLIVSLSGNPFGALANLELLVRPVIAHISGDESWRPKHAMAVMTEPFEKASPGRRFVRACCCQGSVSLPQGLHASGVLGSMKGCNCFIDIEAGNQGLKPGDEVNIILL